MMAPSNVFGAVRATTIAALCAGAGITLAGCGKSEEAKPAGGSGAPAAEKPAGEHQCGGDNKCGASSCGAKDKK
jgi:hypothetical protein